MKAPPVEIGTSINFSEAEARAITGEIDYQRQPTARTLNADRDRAMKRLRTAIREQLRRRKLIP